MSTEPTTYAIERSHSFLIVRVMGELMMQAEEFLNRLFWSADLKPETLATVHAIIVDVRGTKLSSEGLYLFIGLQTRLHAVRPDGIVAIVCTPESHTEHVLNNTQLTRIFTTFESVELAIADLERTLQGRK